MRYRFPGSRNLDDLDRAILDVAYHHIEESPAKLVAGSTIWETMRAISDIAPVHIPARIKRLISLGLLVKEVANSSSRTKVYAPTDAGYQAWEAIKLQTQGQ